MKDDFNILIVDDEKNIRENLCTFLKKHNFKADFAGTYNESLEKFYHNRPDILIVDIAMPDGNGIDLLKIVKFSRPQTKVLMISGASNIENAVKSIKLGAYDFFTKPLNFDEILHIINKLKNTSLISNLNTCPNFSELVGTSDCMRKIFNDIETVAKTEVPVLITGESGTGKDLVARAIHKLSKRRKNSFVPINCSAIPEELLESELFGYEKGAFSGADKLKYGLFEMANMGTVFLDEIGEMPFSLQPKILRCVETKKVRRTGGVDEISINFRVISATNSDIKDKVLNGKFRNDLFFRLSTFTINIAPLRERKEDIPIIIDNFFCKKDKPFYRLSEEVLEAFLLYDWPGNVRELENVVERMMIVSCDNILNYESLPVEIQNTFLRLKGRSYSKKDFIKKLKDVEKEHILNVYKNCNFNKNITAKILGLGLKTLYRKLKEFE